MGEIRMGSLGHIGVVRWICLFFMGWNVSPGAGKALQITERAVIVPEISLIENELEELLSYGLYDPTGEGKRYRECLIEKMLEGSPPMCSEHIKEVSKVIKYGAPGPSPVASSSEASSRILVVYSGANDGVAKGCVYPFEQEPVALVEKGCQEINFTNLNKYHRVYMINAQWLPSYVPATKSIAFSSNQMNFSAEVQQHQSFSPTRGKEMFLLEVKDIPDTKMLSEVKNKNVKAACYSGNKGKFCYVAAGLIPETALFYRGTDCIVVGLEFNCSSFYKKLKPESLQPKSLQAKFRLPTETKPEGIVRLPDDQLCYAACDDEVYYSTDVETCAIMMQAKPYLSGDANEHSPNCPKQFKRTENRINYAVNYGLESLEANDYLKKLIVPYIRTSSFPSPAGGTLGFRFYANPEIRSDKLIPPTEGTPSIRSSTAATGGYTSNDGLYFLDLSRMQVIQHTRVVMSTQLEVLSTEPRKVDNMKLFDELLYGYGREEANCKPPTDKTLQKSLEGLRRHLDQLQDLSVPTMAQYPGSKGRREAMRQLFYEFMFVKSESYRDVLSEMLRYFGISFTKRKIDNAAKKLPGLIDNLEKATMQESGKSLSAEFECAALAQRFSLTKNSRDFHLMVYLEKKLEDDGIYAYAAFIADMVFVAIPENEKLMNIQNCKTLELRNILSDCEKEKANLECEFEIQLHDIQAEHVLKELKLDGYFELLDDIELPGQDSLVFLPNKFTGRDVLNNIISLKNLLPFKTWTDVSNFIVGAAEVSYVLAVRGLCNQEAYAYAMSLSNTYAKDYEKEFARLLKDKFSLQSLSCVWISLIESGESVELESVSITQEVFDLLKSQKLPHLANISGHKLYENVPQTVADITNIEMESYSAVENNFKGQVVFTSNQRLDTMKKFVLEGELYIFDLVWILTGESYCFRHIYSDVWNLGGNGQDTANDCKKICSSPNDICNYIYMRVPAQPAELFEEFGALIEQGSPPETPKLWGYFTVPHDFEATTHELRLFSVDETNTRKLENSPNDKGPSTYTYVFEGLAVNSSSFVITHKNGARGLLRISSGWALIPHTTYDKPFTCRHFHQMIKKKSGAEYAESEVAAEHRFSTTRFSYATEPNKLPGVATDDTDKHYFCSSYCGANLLSIDLDQKTCEAVQSMDFLLPDRTFDVLDNIETCQPRTLQAEMVNLSFSYLADLIPSPNIHGMKQSTTMGERPALIYVSLTNGGGTQKSPCSSLVSRKGEMYFFFTQTLTVETYECFKPWKLTTVPNGEVNTELLTELLGADPGKELLEVIKRNLMKNGDSELINAIRSFSEKPDANSLKVAVVAEAKKVLANATSSAGSESSSQSGGLVGIDVRGDAGEKTSAAQAHDEEHKRDMEGNKNKEGGNNKEEDDKHNQDKHKQNDHKDKDNQSEHNGSDEVQSISEQQNRDSPDKSTAEVPKIASEEIEQPSAGQNGTSVTSDSIYSPKLGKGNVDKDTDDKNSKEENGDKKNNDGVNKDKENKDKDKRNIEVKPIGRSDDTPSERTKPQVSIDLSGTSGEISGEGKNQDSRNAVEKHMDDGSGVALDGRTSKISGSDKNDQSSNSGTAPVNSPQSGSSTKASDEDAKKKLNKEDVESPAKDKSGDDTIVKDPAKNTSKDENKNAGAEHIDISNGGSLESALADEKVTITDDKQSSIFDANSDKIPLESVSNSGSHSGDDLHGKDSDESPGQNNEPPYAPQDSTAPSSSSKLPSGDAVDNNSEIENTKDESEDQNHSKGYKSNDSAHSGSSLGTTLVEDDANEDRFRAGDAGKVWKVSENSRSGLAEKNVNSDEISQVGSNKHSTDLDGSSGRRPTGLFVDSQHNSLDNLSNKRGDSGDGGSQDEVASGSASKTSSNSVEDNDDNVDKDNMDKDKENKDKDKKNNEVTLIDTSDDTTSKRTETTGPIVVPETSEPILGEGKNQDSKSPAVENDTSSKTDSFPQANSSRDSSESNKSTGTHSEEAPPDNSTKSRTPDTNTSDPQDPGSASQHEEYDDNDGEDKNKEDMKEEDYEGQNGDSSSKSKTFSTALSSSSKLLFGDGDAVDKNSGNEDTKHESEHQAHSQGYERTDSADSRSSLRESTAVDEIAVEEQVDDFSGVALPGRTSKISGSDKNDESSNSGTAPVDSPQSGSSTERSDEDAKKKITKEHDNILVGDTSKNDTVVEDTVKKTSKDDTDSEEENEEKENNDGDDKDKEDGDKENTFTPIDGSESGTGEPTKPPDSIDLSGTSGAPGTSSPGTSSPGTAPDGEGKNPDSKNIAVEDHTSSKTDSFPQANSSRDSSESNKKTGNNSEGQLGDEDFENKPTSHGSESARRNSRNSPEAPSSHKSSENHSDTGESDRQPSRNSQEATSHGTRSRSDETTDSSQNSTDTQHDNGDTDDEGTESDKQYAMFLNLLVRRLLWKEEATFQGNRKTDISAIAPAALAFVSSHKPKLETLYYTKYATGKVHTTEFYSGDVYRQLFYKTHEQDGFELGNEDIEDFRKTNVDLYDMLSYVLRDDCDTVGLIFTNWGDMEVKWPMFFDTTAGADPINSVRTLFDLEAFSEPFAQAFSRFNEVRDSRPPAAGNLTCNPPLQNVPRYEYELCELLKKAVERKLVDQKFKKLIQYLNTDKEELAAFVAECAWRPKAFLAGWKNATSRELNLPFHPRNGDAAQSLSSYAEDKERQNCDRIKVHFEALEPLHWDTLKLSSIQRIFSEYTFASALLESEHLQAITTLGLQMPDELFQVRTVLPSVNVIGLAQLRNILGKLEKLKRGFQSNKNKPVSSVPEVPAQIDNWKNDWKHLRVVLMIIKNNREPLHSDEWDALFLSGLAILNGEQRDKISGVLPGKLTMTFEKLTESHQQLLETAISTIKSPDYALTNKVERCVDGSSKMNIWLYLTDKTKQEKVLRSIVPKEPRRLKALGSYSQASVSPFASEYLRRLGDKKSVYHLLIKYYKDATLHIFELIFKGIEGSALKNLVKQTNSELNLLEDTNDIPAKLGDIITKDAKAIRSKFGGDLSFKYVFTDFPGKYDNLAPEPFSPFEPKSAATSAHQAWGYIALCLFSVLLTLT